jgi:hypothetical protein
MKNVLAENLLRFGVKNLSESNHSKLLLLIEQEDQQPKRLEVTINFPSGMHSAAKANFATTLDPKMAEIEKFLQDNQANSKVVKVILDASESQVPNYDGEVNPKRKLEIGDLSKMRYATIEAYMKNKETNWLQSGLISKPLTFEKTEPKRGATPWNPPANATAEEIKKLAADPKYTAEQYLKMFIEVETEMKTPDPTTVRTLTSVKTNRESISTTANNPVFFYSYSRAAAAILGVDYTTLPSQLLTMNKAFRMNSDQSKDGVLNLPPFNVGIQPNGGQNIPVVVYDRNYLSKPWTARIADTYNLIIPFKEGTKQWENAWLFACWYIHGKSQLNDWDKIANKPNNINFNAIKKIEVTEPAGIQGPTGQTAFFEKNGKFYKLAIANGELEETDANLEFNVVYKKIVDTFYKENPPESE